MCVLNNKIRKYVRQKLIELDGEIVKSTIMIGDFYTPLTVIENDSLISS